MVKRREESSTNQAPRRHQNKTECRKDPTGSLLNQPGVCCMPQVFQLNFARRPPILLSTSRIELCQGVEKGKRLMRSGKVSSQIFLIFECLEQMPMFMYQRINEQNLIRRQLSVSMLGTVKPRRLLDTGSSH